MVYNFTKRLRMTRYLFLVLVLGTLLAPPVVSAHYEGELLPDSVAVMEYQMIISMKPTDTITRNKLGMVYIRQNKLDRARKEFMEVLKVAPSDFDALDSLGIVSDKEGRFDGSVVWYGKALEVKDDKGARQRLNDAKKKLGH